MFKKYFAYIGFLFYSIFQTILLFSKVPNDKFLFIGDQFIRFNLSEVFRNAFYLRKLENFGVFNAWQLTVQTPDILFYSIVYKLGLNIRSAEMLLTALIIFITLSLSYLGFSKLQKLFYSDQNLLIVLAVTIWYSMNPYLLVMWHGAIYNFGSSITYSLAPLIIYYFHIALTDPKATKERLICALLMFVSSFTFWMFAATCFFLILYTIGYLAFNKKLITNTVVNGLKLMAIYLPLCAVIIYPILHEYFNNQGDVNGTFYATFGQIKGGLLYQFLMYFSWGIYNVWTPRSIYPPIISNFYFSPFYITATLALYALLAWPIVLIFRNNPAEKLVNLIRKNYYPTILLLIFFFSIFLAKGKEPPFGWIFLFLYEHVPFFTVFRSSDHRFGFPAVLAICILLIVLLSKNKRTKLIVGSLIAITFIQNYVFFSGDLIIGQNKDTEYFDRVVKITEPYNEVAEFLKSDNETSYIFPYPSTEYGLYNLGEGETHIGQDILAKTLNKNFAYIPVTSGMYIPTAQILVNSINNQNIDFLKQLPIKYLLLRTDTTCAECPEISKSMLENKTVNVFSNELFNLYQINSHTPVVNSTSPIIFRKSSPIKFEVQMNNVKESAIISLMQSMKSNWNVYIDTYSEICQDPIEINANTKECSSEQKLVDFSDLTRSNRLNITRSFSETAPSVNTWTINSSYIKDNFSESYYHKNEDGSYNFRITIFYTPQQSYLWSIVITLISVITVTVLIIIPIEKIKSLLRR